jgi:nitrogen fixation protein FixH
VEKKRLLKPVLYNLMNKLNFNWGHGIIVTFVLFGAFMAYFYIHMSKESIELVGKNYYADGQAFQQKINEREQTAALSVKASLEFSADFKQAKIHFPATVLQGRIVFYRPSNAVLDKSLEINADTSGTAFIPTDFLNKGPWNVSLTWEKDGKNYIEEQRIIIP